MTRPASERPAALAARQREHRLRERMKPKHPLAANADPWLLAASALDKLESVKGSLPPGGHARVDLEEAEELVKQLAWGPEDSP
jgi:hypothetical protein